MAELTLRQVTDVDCWAYIRNVSQGDDNVRASIGDLYFECYKAMHAFATYRDDIRNDPVDWSFNEDGHLRRNLQASLDKFSTHLESLVTIGFISPIQHKNLIGLVNASFEHRSFTIELTPVKLKEKLMAREDLHPTDHLREAMKERSVTWGEIIDVVNKYENSYGPDEKGRITYQKGNLCVVADAKGAIVTVLLRRESQWTNEDARARKLEEQRAYNQHVKNRQAQNQKPKTRSHYKRKKRQQRGNQ